MKRLQIILFLLIISNLMFGQNLESEVHEWYAKELVIKNDFQKVIFTYENGEIWSLFFDKRGYLIKEIESKNWHTKDTTEKKYKYEKDLLSEVIHLTKSNRDTLSYYKYFYENGKLQLKSGRTLSNKEITNYNYNQKGKLTSSKVIMTTMYSQDTMKADFREYDDQERLIYLKRRTRDKEDIYVWDYQEEYTLHKRKRERYKNEKIEQIFEFDDSLKIRKVTTITPDGEKSVSITELKYNKDKLLSELLIDNKQLFSVSYIKNKH